MSRVSNSRNQVHLVRGLVVDLLALRLLRVLLVLPVLLGLHDLADVVPLRRRQRERPRVVVGLVDGLLARLGR